MQLAYWYLLVAPGDGCWGRPWGTGCAAFHHVLRYVRAGNAAELASPMQPGFQPGACPCPGQGMGPVVGWGRQGTHQPCTWGWCGLCAEVATGGKMLVAELMHG